MWKSFLSVTYNEIILEDRDKEWIDEPLRGRRQIVIFFNLYFCKFVILILANK